VRDVETEFAGQRVEPLRADRHADIRIFAGAAVAVFTLAVLTPFGAKRVLVDQVVQCRHPWIRDERRPRRDHRRRPAPRNEFSAGTRRRRFAVARDHFDLIRR
jgi:hypothetical protein